MRMSKQNCLGQRLGERACLCAEHKHPARTLVFSLGILASLFMLFCFTGSAQRTPQGPVATAASPNATLIAATESGAVARPTGVPARAVRVGWSIGRAQQDPVGIMTARNAALVAATNDVLKETSDIRQLSILHPVQSSTQSRAEIERMVIKNLEQDTTPAEMHADEIMLKRLGLVPEDFQYGALIIRLLTEQVAGYYDPKTQQFHLADWIDLDGQKPIMAHELTHALQDQHFDLRRFEHWPKGNSDAELAVHALIEGDATLVMAQYISNNPLRALAFLKSLGTTGMATAELQKSPRAVRETLLFPYQEGLGWTRTLYREGGWDRVSKAFNQLPQSTEQILHSEKYFAHEAPVKVTLPDIARLLNSSERAAVRSVPPALAGGSSLRSMISGDALTRSAGVRDHQRGSPAGALGSPAPVRRSLLSPHHSLLFSPTSDPRSPTPTSWRRLAYDVEGEWGFYLILDQFLKSSAESRRAAAGWGGDRFEIYEGPNGQACFISLSVWDTENDAREFFDAYVKRSQIRYPEATTLSPGDGAAPQSELKVPNAFTWKTNDGMVRMDLRGSRVVIIESGSDLGEIGSLLKALER